MWTMEMVVEGARLVMGIYVGMVESGRGEVVEAGGVAGTVLAEVEAPMEAPPTAARGEKSWLSLGCHPVVADRRKPSLLVK